MTAEKSFGHIINRRRAAGSPSRFSSSLAKTLNLEAYSQVRRKKPKAKAMKSNSKSVMSASTDSTKRIFKTTKKDGLTPLQRFRRGARLVKLLVTVCNVCRDLLVYAIKDEQWYEFCEKFLKDASAGGTPIDKHSFITTVRNPVTKEIEQLEFDAAQFKHDYHSGISLLTEEIKTILVKAPGTRTPKEIEECVHCIKRLVPSFRGYTYEQQKQICQLATYDRYFQERVILRTDLPPDGIYFVLNGILLESGEKLSSPKVIKPGDKFGEEDLKSGMSRQSNVMTKSSVDLLYLHKFDYEEIFELSVELAGEPTKVFEICKQVLVFKYYPISELIKNPGRWQVLKFKYGRLIAANSCETEFIYVIRSGEARIMKALTTKTINVAQRRKRLQAELDSTDPFVYQKNLLDFVSDNKFHASRYSLNAFSAKNLAADSRSISERVQLISRGSQREPAIENVNRSKSSVQLSSSEDGADQRRDEETEKSKKSQFCRKNRAQTACQLPQNETAPKPQRPHTTKPSSSTPEEETDMYRLRKTAMTKTVPPFVQVDSLQAGGTYGMRSLLPPNQRGEPAALVSAGCEVIQINRKFFAKYLDDNMINIIALKAKVYPSEDELLKRLDVNLQWEEYCAIVMCRYLDSKVVGFRGSHVVLPQ
ncbi:cyclic nucleotide-binding domain-containing protein 2-like [Watersipora subatra]|uniref:cyclic nucleotide-binding domain-containing protein 2-like n=1 Tax=Watersipora subatra TaxID=2589382 RepID=UPI00355C0CB7